MKLYPVLGLLAMTVMACSAHKPAAAPVQLTNALLPDPDVKLPLDTIYPWEEEPAVPAMRTWGVPAEEQKLPQVDEFGNPMHL